MYIVHWQDCLYIFKQTLDEMTKVKSFRLGVVYFIWEKSAFKTVFKLEMLLLLIFCHGCSCLNFASNSLSVCRTKLVPICNASRRSVSMETVSSRGLKRRFEEVDSGSPCSTPKDSDDDISSSDSADSCDSLNAPSSSLTRKNTQVNLMTSLL